MKALADWVHAKGLKMGLYSDAGAKTCEGREGSRGREYQDAQRYATWGIDYVKYDWCNTDDLNPRGAYNAEVIAVDQDALGIGAFPYATLGGVEIWIRPLRGGAWALCALNRRSFRRRTRALSAEFVPPR